MYDYETGQIDRLGEPSETDTIRIKITVTSLDTGRDRAETKWLTIGTTELAAIREVFARREK